MLLHLPSEDRWVAVFLAFQSQCRHTDETKGNCIGDVEQPAEDKGAVIITLLNSEGLKVHGVQYNKNDVSEQGRIIVF